MFMKYKDSFICANTLPKIGYLEINKTGKMLFQSPSLAKERVTVLLMLEKKATL